MTELVQEPKRRRNGRCARPGCEKPVPVPTTKQKGVDPQVYLKEPFCSSRCARDYYGTSIEIPGPHQHQEQEE